MKIGFIDVTAANSIGGIQTAVWKLSESLSNKGHEVHIVSGAGEVNYFRVPDDVKVHLFHFKPREDFPNIGSRFQRICERISLSINAKKAVSNINFDWIILTKPFDFFWPFLVKNPGTKYMFMSGGTDFFPGDRFFKNKINSWVSCSYFNAWQIHAHYKINPSVIYNGVDTDSFTIGVTPKSSLKKLLGIPNNHIVFAFAGRLVGWKGINVAIQAAKICAANKLDISLVVIGDGPEKNEIKRQITINHLQSTVYLYGKAAHDELPSLYSQIDVGIFPSIGDEAFGITIAEAMSCGKPVIASHIGGIPEVVGNEGSSGLLVAPNNAEALAAAMQLLYCNPRKRIEMGANARNRILQNFTWDKSAERLLNATQ